MQNPIDKAAFWVGLIAVIAGVGLGPFIEPSASHVIMAGGLVIVATASAMTGATKFTGVVLTTAFFGLVVLKAHLGF